MQKHFLSLRGAMIIIALLLSFSFVSAAESQYKSDTFAAGTVDLWTTCIQDNGNEQIFCDSISYCNITELIAPDWTFSLTNVTMTMNTDGYFNYTTTLTTEGYYVMKTTCTNTSLISRDIKLVRVVDALLANKIDALNMTVYIENLTVGEIWHYTLENNISANTTIIDIYNSTAGFQDTGYILMIFATAAFFLFMGFKMDDAHIAVKLIFIVIAMLCTLLGVNIARLSAASIGATANIISMINVTYIILIWVFSAFTIYLIIYAIMANLPTKKNEEDDE